MQAGNRDGRPVTPGRRGPAGVTGRRRVRVLTDSEAVTVTSESLSHVRHGAPSQAAAQFQRSQCHESGPGQPGNHGVRA